MYLDNTQVIYVHGLVSFHLYDYIIELFGYGIQKLLYITNAHFIIKNSFAIFSYKYQVDFHAIFEVSTTVVVIHVVLASILLKLAIFGVLNPFGIFEKSAFLPFISIRTAYPVDILPLMK